jgi:membrane-associated phospholipid phosphatase
MLLWAGIAFVLVGIASIAIDRQAAHLLYDHVNEPFFRFLDATTHWAKAGHWLIAAVIAYAASQTAMRFWPGNADLHLASKAALAFIASLAAGSVVLHGIKLVLGRRRPRDDMEMGLYGFLPFSFDLQYNSFPSGHALTIMCVAAIACCIWPHLALLWFAIALWLAVTRALLTAHFLSDVFVGAGIGLIAAREVVLNFFPTLAPSWF